MRRARRVLGNVAPLLISCVAVSSSQVLGAPPIPIACGDLAVPGSNTDPSSIGVYTGCGVVSYPMGEALYRFRPGTRVVATASTTDFLNYNLFAFREADGPGRCLSVGDWSVTLANVGPEDLIFALDSMTTAGPTNLSLDCVPMTTTEIACGETVRASTSGFGSYDRYTCLGDGQPGGEAQFVLDIPSDGGFAVTVTPTDPAMNLDVAVFDAPFEPSSPECSVGGDSGSALWPNAPAGGYLLVVDGDAASSGASFDISVACDSGPLACGAVPDLTCNQPVAGNTAAGADNIVFYGGAAEAFTGPELVYHFYNPVEKPVGLRLSASTPMLDFMLLGSCDPSSLVAWGHDTIVVPRLPPGDYYVAVDGRAGSVGTFDLLWFCDDAALEPPVLTTTLTAGQCYTETKELFFPVEIPVADVMLSFDLTASMTEELNTVKDNAQAVYRELSGLVSSLQFGVASLVEYNTPYVDTVCGREHYGAGYPYRLEQPLTPDIGVVDGVLGGLGLVGGGGGFGYGETYTRSFYEAVNDLNIGWRDCASHVWMSFGDEPAMDCNWLECTGGFASTGRDPGPDMVTGTADDLLLIPTVDEMAANCISLVPVHSSGDQEWTDNWGCLARRTGGQVFPLNRDGTVPDGTDIVSGMVDVILDTVRNCPEVRLEPVGPQAGWVAVTPSRHLDVETPFYGRYSIDFCVPPGTPPGDYDLTIEAHCDRGDCSCGADLIGTQEVHIEVVELCPVLPVAAAAAPPQSCIGSTVTLDASASTDCDGAGLMYRWLDAGAEVCGWSPSPSCDVVASDPTSYTVEVACIGSPDCAAQAEVVVDVLPVPIAVLDPTTTLCVGEALTLSAAGSDPAGCPVPLEYQFRNGAAIVRPWGVVPTYGPLSPAATASYTVEVRCRVDTECISTTDEVVEVVPLPAAVAGPDVSVCEQVEVTLDASGSIDGGCPGGLQYEWRDGPIVVRPANPDPSWTPPVDQPGTTTYTVVVRCTGPPGCEAIDEVIVEVQPCTLAVHYDRFDAVWQESGVSRQLTVTWATLREDGTRAFVIERGSSSTGPFQSIDTLRAEGPGYPYEIVDTGVAAGSTPWYRIIELTVNGRGDATPAFQARKGSTRGASSRGRGRSRGHRLTR